MECFAERMVPKTLDQQITGARQHGQRMKQLHFGANTDGFRNYDLFLEAARSSKNPLYRRVSWSAPVLRPPRVDERCTKSEWVQRVRAWRKALHHFDDVRSVEQWVARVLAISGDSTYLGEGAAPPESPAGWKCLPAPGWGSFCPEEPMQQELCV